jgi:gamma-glutamyltranspeptidase
MKFDGCRAVGLLLILGVTVSMHWTTAFSQESNHKRTLIGGYDRSPGPAHQTRSVTYAEHGMAATSDLRSTQAAVDILREGGSAVDAAIAANCVLGVVENR